MLKARRITKDELAKTGELFRIAFEFPDENAEDNAAILKRMEEHPERRGSRYALEKWAAFDEEGNMAAWIGGMRFTARFDGHELPMSGVGGVSSLPQYRRQGGVRMCFENLLRDNYDDGVVLSYLFPFSTKFYGRFGYEPTGKICLYSIPLRAIDPDDSVGGSIKPHYMGSCKQDIIKVYNDYTRNYNLSCVRDESDWERLDNSDMSKTGQYIYVWYNDAGEAKGVIGFTKEKNAVEKFDLMTNRMMFWFSDAEGLRGLLQFARGFEVYYRNLCVKLAADFPIGAYVREWAMYPQECGLYSMGMARVINVQKALECAAYRGSGELKIAVQDRNLSENNHTFAVVFADGKATEVKVTEDAPDVVMPIAMFSKFLLGDAQNMECYPGVKILCEPEKAAKVFYPKKMLILDSF